ncbi:hypothetical protein QFZ35_000769 [Arthrobacter ulcerisalmonis]|nr:hypothetical protein [Arthrobacter ulcerisalmonis]
MDDQASLSAMGRPRIFGRQPAPPYLSPHHRYTEPQHHTFAKAARSTERGPRSLHCRERPNAAQGANKSGAAFVQFQQRKSAQLRARAPAGNRQELTRIVCMLRLRAGSVSRETAGPRMVTVEARCTCMRAPCTAASQRRCRAVAAGLENVPPTAYRRCCCGHVAIPILEAATALRSAPFLHGQRAMRRQHRCAASFRCDVRHDGKVRAPSHLSPSMILLTQPQLSVYALTFAHYCERAGDDSLTTAKHAVADTLRSSKSGTPSGQTLATAPP